MKELTLCLMTCGEKTESECLSAIKEWSDKITFIEVRNVFPQIKALNQMIDQVETDFFIPLDADIVLKHNAYSRIRNAIHKWKYDSDWHSILFPLWDTLTERKILALKILRTSIMKEIPFEESATPDVLHYRRLTDAGYKCIHDYLEEPPIGEHIIRGHHYCYHKYRDVYMTYRSHNFEWDSGAFFGGKDLKSRAKAHYDFFITKWILTSNDDYLSCIAGMMDGLTAELENKSKTLDNKEYRFSNESAAAEFLKWHSTFKFDWENLKNEEFLF